MTVLQAVSLANGIASRVWGPLDEPVEDTVLRKLQWYRDGGEVSDRQWSDVLGILMAQGGRLDEGYLRQWSDALRLSDLLDRALRELQGA
jgi:hypothetical protein